ncbi:MAG TPA: hypothetical protein VGS03_16100 [Candidatus Polarisedimenticolia bacterium]|jgi:hypothetical protein|nr:hypothetical protein [Candidatus Polarisedimenticolia bacterium]
MKISRRVVGRMILGAPLLAAGGSLAGALKSGARADEPEVKPADAAAEPAPEPTPLAKFLAKQEDGLSGDERAKVRKDVTQLEDALKVVRDFPVGNDVPPAGGFKPIRSVRRNG